MKVLFYTDLRYNTCKEGMKMTFKERGTPERGIDRMVNEGGGVSALDNLFDRHPDEETPRNTDNLAEDQKPEDTGRPDDRKNPA